MWCVVSTDRQAKGARKRKVYEEERVGRGGDGRRRCGGEGGLQVLCIDFIDQLSVAVHRNCSSYRSQFLLPNLALAYLR